MVPLLDVGANQVGDDSQVNLRLKLQEQPEARDLLVQVERLEHHRGKVVLEKKARFRVAYQGTINAALNWGQHRAVDHPNFWDRVRVMTWGV